MKELSPVYLTNTLLTDWVTQDVHTDKEEG